MYLLFLISNKNIKLIVIIQARSGSTRFKNKVLLEVHGKPLIWYVVRQIKKSKKVKKIVVAIPKSDRDKNLYSYLKKNKMNIYRGDENNVAKRMLFAAKKFKANNFMRISADSPLIKTSIINKCINLKKNFFNYDLITNVFPRSFPSGQSVEIINTNVLQKNIKFMKKSELEHVTKYFYNNSTKFSIKNFTNKNKYKQFKSSIDTINDFKKLKHLIKK